MRYRAILSTALLLMGFSVLAQAPVTRSFEVADTFDRSALKFMIEAVANIDPMANVTYSDDMRIVQVKSAQLSEAEMRTALESTGLQLREGLADLSTYLPAADPSVLAAEFSTGVKENGHGSDMLLMPNPTKSVLEVQLKDRTAATGLLTVMALDGRVILVHRVQGFRTVLDVAPLASGLYTLNWRDQNGNSSTHRFVKE